MSATDSQRRRRAQGQFWSAGVWASLCGGLVPAAGLLAQGDSRVMLQMFESGWENNEYRVVDIWNAGYKDIWVPPTGRADIGDFSVGYDVYDRFDLGDSTRKTLYGTAESLKQFNRVAQRAGLFTYADIILNHNGFSDNNTTGFQQAGDYPGFVISAPGAPWGDFHDPSATSEHEQRISGLIDIAHESNLQYIRHPVDPDDPRNIPPGTVPLFGRLADVPDASNRQYYTDRQGESVTFFNPLTGEQVTKYRFNLDNPMAGDAVSENATGLLLRYTQWMAETVGFDGFRVDAQKHIPQWFFDQYYDNATYASGREMLNGERLNPFSFGEVFDGDTGKLLSYVEKNGVANRDVLDFKLFFSMRENLTGNGLSNDWRSVVGSGLDVADNGFTDGSVGVRFVQSHDEGGPTLSNVAHAYSMLLPGRSIVYFNAKQFGEGRDFPKDGRGDALGGIYGNRITTISEIANSHGRGEYHQRHLTKETLVYERDANVLVGLSNRSDTGYDTVTVQTNFKPGTVLVELTGNSEDSTIDPNNQIARYVQVDANGRATITVPRNASSQGTHNTGYVMYGPAGPQGDLSLTNVAFTLAPDDFSQFNNYENGSNRLSEIAVIQNENFDISLQTEQVILGQFGRDREAEGDNAIFRINGGTDVTGQGYVSTNPDDLVTYGFQQFADKRSSLWDGGDGEFRQAVDASQLVEGMNYLTVRAFRHRDPGDGSAIFTDFRQAIYIDLLPPESAIAFPTPTEEGRIAVVESGTYQFVLESVDYTANSMHLLLNEEGDPYENLTEGNKATQVDRAEFRKTYGNLEHGVLKLDLVTFEITGNTSLLTQYVLVRLFALGDLNQNGTVSEADFALFGDLWGLSFLDEGYDPSADFDENGVIDAIDYGLFADYLMQQVPAASSALTLLAGMIFFSRRRRAAA